MISPPTILYVHQPGLLAQAALLFRRLEADSPVAVAEGRVVRDASPAALLTGIRVGESVTRARRLCPMLLVLPVEEVDARELSHRLWGILSALSPVVEPAGADAAYAQLQSRKEAQVVLARLASRFPGMPPPALAASFSKLAARATAEGRVGRLEEAPVSALLYPGDPKVIDKLQRLGLGTFGAAQDIGEAALLYQFGRRIGTVLHRRARGIDDDPLRALWPPRTIHAGKDFDLDPIEDMACLELWLSRLSQRVASELSASGSIARKVALTLITERTSRSRSWLPPLPLSSEREVLQAVSRLLAQLPPDAPVTRLTLQLSELELPQARSLSLFAPASAESLLRLESARRLILERYGAAALTTLGAIPLSLRDRRRSLAREAGALA